MEKPATLTEEQERPRGLLEVDGELVEDISALLVSGEEGMVLNLVADLFPADLALLLSHLPFDRAYQLFHWLPVEQAADVLAEMDSSFRAAIMEDVPSHRVAELLDPLDTDDAADVLADVREDIVFQVLPTLEDAADVQELLGYGVETAGGIMGTEYVAVTTGTTLRDAIEEVRRNAEHVEEVYTLFVVDDEQRLEGVIPLKQLLLTPPDTTAGAVMDPDYISVTTDVDQEEVARVMERYDLVSLPVVNELGRLVGRITIDDVVDVIRDEAEEDMQLMSGVSGGEEPTDSVLTITRGRLPWLIIGLCGAGLSGFVIGAFEEALEQAVVLATFIPIVMAMAGNAGIQSSAIVVQGLASGEVWSSDVLRRLGKELAVALLNGLVLAVLLGLAVVFFISTFGAEAEPARLAFTASLSLLIVILMAACIGTTVPLLLFRVGVDPAIATGPFITTSNDILGLGVFFLLATLLYL